MNIQLPTGKTIYISTYEWLFILKDEEIDNFYESCIADDLGVIIENPFTLKTNSTTLEVEEIVDISL